MRSVLVTLLVGLAVAPATANPRTGAVPTARVARETRPTPAPPQIREPAVRRPELPSRVTRPLAPSREERHEVKMPTVWSDLHNVVSDKLPHGGNERAFSYTLMPMVITGAADSAPGLGLSGSF